MWLKYIKHATPPLENKYSKSKIAIHNKTSEGSEISVSLGINFSQLHLQKIAD